MCQEDVAEAIRRAIGWFKENRAPGSGRPGPRYARIARAAFDEINALTAEGFGYAAVCEALEVNGLLPGGSKPCSLSRAVRREGGEAAKARKVSGACSGRCQGTGRERNADGRRWRHKARA